jgi:hypothetical protein
VVLLTLASTNAVGPPAGNASIDLSTSRAMASRFGRSSAPFGFVVDAGLKTMQEFTQKYEVLDLGLQTEVQDSQSGDVLAASVLRRGESGGVDRQLSFDVLVTAADVLGDRLACRIDNAHVPAAQCIDCRSGCTRESPEGDQSLRTAIDPWRSGG